MEEVQQTETKTYADGSQRVGVPPFPETSPKEDAAADLRRVGEPPAPAPAAPAASNVVTADQLEAPAATPGAVDVEPAPAPAAKGKK